VNDALTMLKQHPDAKVMAGGQSLLSLMKLRAASPPMVIDIGRIRDLAYIREEKDHIAIGALTTHTDIERSAVIRSKLRALGEAAEAIGDLQVRNRGTIGGSLAHADPGADYPTVVVAAGATLLATGPAGAREIAAEGFFKDLFTTDLKPGEILTAVRVPTYARGTGGCYLKHRHPASSFAVVGVAALVTVAGGKCSRVSLVVGGVTVNPVRARAAEAALTGQAPGDAAFAAAAAKAADSIGDPLSDPYASGDFRRHLATVMAKRALAAAAQRATG
jgi:carbon-monoxide dehydrogenase medium subunit